jgi:long-chain-fatty-acid---luciferin-component ligase
MIAQSLSSKPPLRQQESFDSLVLKLNEFIANLPHYIRLHNDTAYRLRDSLITSCFAHHYHNNQFYRDFCDNAGVTPEVVRNEGVEKIPALPISIFKDSNSHLLLTRPITDIEFELRSTGTSGIPSVSRRDSQTVDMLSHVFTSIYREFFRISTGCGLFLCPSPSEVPEMGMVKAFNFLSGMLDDRKYIVERYSFRSEEAVSILREWEDRADRYIIGPPFMINRLVKYLARTGTVLPLDPKSKIVMLGGWKRFTGEEIPRNTFDEHCMQWLGIGRHQIRDMYGLVECNFLAIECDYNAKHVPPWVRFIIRDLNDNEVIGEEGRAGRITILDPTCFSYPCFIETEDVGYIYPDGICACGRHSQVMSFSRRVEGAELGCCAINMERYMETEVVERLCQL